MPDATEPASKNVCIDGIGAGAQAVLRFAPSPTGRLHLGHALSALLNVEVARRLGGRLLIRIEDTDLARCRPEHTTAILEDLAWLGVHSDGPVLRQSEQLPVYAEAASQLVAMGLLYPCFCSRQEVQTAAAGGGVDPDGAPIYPGLCKGLDQDVVARRRASGAPFALRLDMARALNQLRTLGGDVCLGYMEMDEALVPRRVESWPERWGDVVIQRKGGAASYHLAVVVDDARQGITHVVRGADLRASTDVHRLLQVLLGLSAPIYLHHRLIAAVDGRKLSKRHGDTSLAALRGAGLTPADIRRMVGIREAAPELRLFTCL
ncbi:MAG: tRNA glutamyl-Q(34) synthetase GluQRS [Hyphomicrobiaceae bacterium]|nr:tRNA glutamyl-Q(34) synthetase GluQRS [Hyphomicrobiaceae bacterium]